MSLPARDPHQQALLDAAARAGIRAEDLRERWLLDAVRYYRGDRSALVFEGSIYADLGAQVDRICDSKHACKALLEEIGIPTPPSLWVARGARSPAALREQLGALQARAPGARWVCKPVLGTNGVGVVMDLAGADDVLRHLDGRRDDGPWLVEAQLQGTDLRLQAIGGTLVAACVREPAAVVGDGQQTLAALIAARAAAVRAQNHQNDLVVDAQTRALLDAQGLDLPDIPAAGRRVQLKAVANIAQGALAVDVTDEIHPAYGAWMRRIGERLGLSIFALDVICRDHRTDPGAAAPGAVGALEINARPQWLHHTFSERRQHDIPGLILRALLGAPS